MYPDRVTPTIIHRIAYSFKRRGDKTMKTFLFTVERTEVMVDVFQKSIEASTVEEAKTKFNTLYAYYGTDCMENVTPSHQKDYPQEQTFKELPVVEK